MKVIQIGEMLIQNRAMSTADCFTLTHPHPSPPLEREGTFSGAPTDIEYLGVDHVEPTLQ